MTTIITRSPEILFIHALSPYGFRYYSPRMVLSRRSEPRDRRDRVLLLPRFSIEYLFLTYNFRSRRAARSIHSTLTVTSVYAFLKVCQNILDISIVIINYIYIIYIYILVLLSYTYIYNML